MTMVIVDLSHIAYCSLFSAENDIKTVGWAYLKHIMFSRIFTVCNKFKADEVVIAVDSKDNWRKKIYPEYKANRKVNRDAKDQIDWDGFFTTLNEFVAEVKMHFPFYVFEIKYLEADDIIGILAREFQNKQKIIVTADGDFLQLLKYKNVEIFDPIKNKKLTCPDPIRFLKVKCLMGDAGDNVKAIKPKIGIKTAEKLVDDPDKLKLILEDKTPSYTKEDGTVVTMGEEYKENYKNNIILMDLNKTPDVFVKVLIKNINEYELPSGKTIFQYFSSNKFREFLRKMSDLDELVGRIQEFEKKKRSTQEAFSEIL